MGTDIIGWVEFKSAQGEWNHVIDIGLLIDRNYDAFGCLFGVKNYAQFTPLAADRGLPDDLSPQVRHAAEETGEYAFGHTWVTWAELSQLDLRQTAAKVDERIHRYRHGVDGKLIFEGKAVWSADLVGVLGAGTLAPSEGQQWEIGGHLYRAERMSRADAITDDWQVLFEMMGTLAEHYGNESVRLVVWFDA